MSPSDKMQSLKRVEAPHTTQIPHPSKKTRKGTNIILNDDAWRHITSFVDVETRSILACCSTTLRDAVVIRDVVESRFTLAPLTERHLVEFAKRDGFNSYFEDPFVGDEATHSKWSVWFSVLGDIGTLKGKVPTGVTAGVLHLLRYGSRSQLEALAKLCNRDEGFDDPALLLETRKRMQRMLEKAHTKGELAEKDVLDGIHSLGEAYMWMDGVDGADDDDNEDAVIVITCFERAREVRRRAAATT